MDSVLPQVPVRQWVLSFPFPIRFLLATSGKHTNKVLRITQRVLSEFLKKSSGLPNTKTAAVTLVQRFGSSLNLNIHFHILIPDGVFVQAQEKTKLEIFAHLPIENKKLTFMPNQPPTNDEVEMLVGRIHDRVLKYFKRQGYFKDAPEGDPEATDDEQDLLIKEAMAASIRSRIAFGRRRKERVRKMGTLFQDQNFFAKADGPRCRSQNGFSLHANTICQAGERLKLEKLCQYITRPPFAMDRIKLQPNGDVKTQESVF